MDIKNLQQGAKARIKSTGQVVEIKRVSNCLLYTSDAADDL